jgi:hypothetical protein
MAHKDTGFRPTFGMDSYKGLELWEYDIGPQQKNDAVVDGDIALEELIDSIDEIDGE